MARSGLVPDLDHFHRWLGEQRRISQMEVRSLPLDHLDGWRTDPDTGNIRHVSGKFYSVEGLDARVTAGPVERWQQPIINQPEVGILGILVKEFDGVLHCLMQAKIEPGNCNGLQLSPTVQATRSNYTRVHGGASVPYLDYFRDTAGHRVLADVRQSEQGSWFHRKRNRNMVVQVTGEVELLAGFCWLTLGQVHQLLALDDLVNMDVRTVLSCVPFAGVNLLRAFGPDLTAFTSSLIRSYGVEADAVHSTSEVLSWITDVRTRRESDAERIALRDVQGWNRDDKKIAHDSGLFFRVIGVGVTATGRETRAWAQPMIEPCGEGVVAFLAKQMNGVLHLLVHAKAEPGYVDVVELAPTVQCTPPNYDAIPGGARPPFLAEVLAARPHQVRFEAVHSEEGGRFFHARNRYSVIEVEGDVDAGHPDYRWLTLTQLASLVQHSHYVNVQARSLIACLHALSA
ncbi:NDP-hexose 2,3-dehydratase family protein [Streptomyces liangshanensis]|uniref:NDP-hexose 2,3-dehydratase n=1 Tax=Streptomyces liangshanensis TaxID=2717324 RepID=A0A6G9GUA4_9ACTN|nr:NDP-hexose 2,3-dehydratase family protein [Streptomyces liangshanensis]QIQ01838.1 NDP-hexose 2,3-dehydratase [Streptomyces liangshanensis]